MLYWSLKIPPHAAGAQKRAELVRKWGYPWVGRAPRTGHGPCRTGQPHFSSSTMRPCRPRADWRGEPTSCAGCEQQARPAARTAAGRLPEAASPRQGPVLRSWKASAQRPAGGPFRRQMRRQMRRPAPQSGPWPRRERQAGRRGRERARPDALPAGASPVPARPDPKPRFAEVIRCLLYTSDAADE